MAYALLASAALRGVNAEDWVYTVRPGDNLWNLSARHLTAIAYWKRLQAINHIIDPLTIPPGTKLRIPVPWLKKFPMLARVAATVGKVEVFDEDTGRSSPATAGSYLVLGDAVRTDKDSNTTLEFVDGSRLLLQSDSYLKLHHLGVYGSTGMTDTRLNLERGRLETQVTPEAGPASRFEISTPAAVTSVRGTDYRIGTAPAATESRAEVLSGGVDVRSAGVSRLVPGGYGTVAANDRPPLPPVELLPPPDVSALPASFDRVPIQLALPGLPGAEAYRLQISAAGEGARLLFDRHYRSTSLRGPDLADGEYRLRVRAIDGRGLEGANAEHRFVLNARPEPPFPIEPKPQAAVPVDAPVFAWSKKETIGRYHFQIAREPAFLRPVVDRSNISDSRWPADRTLPLGRFFWRVASVDIREGEGPYSDPQEFRRVMPAPEIGEPDIGDDKLVVRWRAGLPGQSYHVQWAATPDCTTPLKDVRTADPFLEIERPDPGEYFIRVQTIEQDGFIGPFGAPQAIDVPNPDLYWWFLVLPLFGLLAL